MSGRSPTKRGRKKKSNKGRKPKKPMSKEEIAAKKNQKNMRETCRRVEINLHYELLYHSLGQNLVYNRAERVQLLRKAITKMAELQAHVTSLTDQIRAAGMTPRTQSRFQLNDSQKLFMLVQRWARNDNGKKCTRAKLKPVGIEIIDDNEHVPITVPLDGRRASEQLSSDDCDHIPFWASWETNTYMVVDQDAFEKACTQAIIAGWDGKLGTKGAYYQRGLPLSCGLTIASSAHVSSTNNGKSSRKYTVHDEDDEDSDDDTQLNDEDEDKYTHHRHTHNNHHNRNNHNPHHVPVFPPRIDFPEIVVQNVEHNMNNNNMSHSSDSRSDNNSVATASEPPLKKQKLNNGRSKPKTKQAHLYSNSVNSVPNNRQFVPHSLPLSVPFPAVGAVLTNQIHPMPYMNVANTNNSILQQTNSTDTASQHNKYMKAEAHNQFPVNTQRVQLPHFLTAFPPQPQTHQFPAHSVSNTHNLIPVTAFPINPMYSHQVVNNVNIQQGASNNSTPNAQNTDAIKKDAKEQAPSLPPMSSITTSINLPPLPSNREDSKTNAICTTISTVSDNEQSTDNIGSEETPPPASSNHHNALSPSESRTSHDTQNSVVFTPSNHRKNSSAISTDSTTTNDPIRTKSPQPLDKHPSIHLPDNTSFLNHQLNWNENNGNRETDEFNDYDVLSSHHHIGMMNEIAVNGFQGAPNANNVEDGNGMKGSVFYG